MFTRENLETDSSEEEVSQRNLCIPRLADLVQHALQIVASCEGGLLSQSRSRGTTAFLHSRIVCEEIIVRFNDGAFGKVVPTTGNHLDDAKLLGLAVETV